MRVELTADGGWCMLLLRYKSQFCWRQMLAPMFVAPLVGANVVLNAIGEYDKLSSVRLCQRAVSWSTANRASHLSHEHSQVARHRHRQLSSGCVWSFAAAVENQTKWTVVSVMRVVTKWPRLESCGFCCKVALYLSYPRINFNDEIKIEFLRISSIIFK